jgi:hypothetical protein
LSRADGVPWPKMTKLEPENNRFKLVQNFFLPNKLADPPNPAAPFG